MPESFPSIADCNSAIDWIEDWFESRKSVYAIESVVRLKIRIEELDSNSGQFYIGLTWYAYDPPEKTDVIAPPGWYMYQWYQEIEDGLNVWQNALNKST